MNKKTLSIVTIIAIVVIIGIVAFKKPAVAPAEDVVTTVPVQKTETQNTQTTPVSNPPQITPTATEKTFTIAQVATHNSDADCYAAINGKVYDLTAWVDKHPGGDRNILKICGKDGSAAFNDQHGGQSKPANILAGFEIGILIN